MKDDIFELAPFQHHILGALEATIVVTKSMIFGETRTRPFTNIPVLDRNTALQNKRTF